MTWLLKWLLVALIIASVVAVVSAAAVWTAAGEVWREAMTLRDRHHRRQR